MSARRHFLSFFLSVNSLTHSGCRFRGRRLDCSLECVDHNANSSGPTNNSPGVGLALCCLHPSKRQLARPSCVAAHWFLSLSVFLRGPARPLFCLLSGRLWDALGIHECCTAAMQWVPKSPSCHPPLHSCLLAGALLTLSLSLSLRPLIPSLERVWERGNHGLSLSHSSSEYQLRPPVHTCRHMQLCCRVQSTFPWNSVKRAEASEASP